MSILLRQTHSRFFVHRTRSVALLAPTGASSSSTCFNQKRKPSKRMVFFFGGVGEICSLAVPKICRRSHARLHILTATTNPLSLFRPLDALGGFARADRRFEISFLFLQKNKTIRLDGLVFLAELERFELSRRYTRPTPLAGEPLRPTWVQLHIFRIKDRY